MSKKTTSKQNSKSPQSSNGAPGDDLKKAHASRQKTYVARKTAAGERRISVWVPPQHLEAFKKTVERLKRKWAKEA